MPRKKKPKPAAYDPPLTDRPFGSGDTLKTYSNVSPLTYLIERAQGPEQIEALGVGVREGALLAWDHQGIVRMLAPGQWEGVRVVEPKKAEHPTSAS